MSLDVYLQFPTTSRTGPVERIFVRRDGRTVEVTRAEWDEMHPGREPVVMVDDPNDFSDDVFWANITHNLGVMAGEVGLYEPLWRPDEVGITHARQLVEPLRDGLARLNEHRDYLQQFNPKNGWGDYDGFVEFTQDYLRACERWPDAEVRVSR